MMGRGYAILDTGTHQSLIEAKTTLFATIEERQGFKGSCRKKLLTEKVLLMLSRLKY